MKKRPTARISRTTTETDIRLSLSLDGKGESSVQSGNGFLDHMLTLFARHGLFSLECTCRGDTEVDFHHSAEDIGICLGQALRQAVGDAVGIVRFGTAYVPMDESLARVCCDICGRPNLVYQVSLADRFIGNFECDLAEDLLKAFCDHARMTLHVDLLRGRNSHHSLEAVFKALAKALAAACARSERAPDLLPSTKGVL